MHQRRTVVAIVVWMVAGVVTVARAQLDELDPTLLGMGGFGVWGTETPAVALPTTFTFNPAALGALRTFLKATRGFELDIGHYTFREGPEVTLNVVNFFFPVKNGLVRLSRFGLHSSTAEARALPVGVTARLPSGNALEISYGYQLNPQWHVGLVLVPIEKVRTLLKDGDVLLAHGEAKSRFQWRAGVHYQPNEQWSAGAVLAWERLGSRVELQPAATGLPVPIEVTRKYRNIITIIGAAYQVRRGTFLIGNWEKYRLTGPNINEDLDILYYGVTQFLSEAGTSITIGSLQRGFFVSGNYVRGKVTLGFSYSPRANRRLEEFIGRSKGGYVWVAINY
ncbi:MAG: hypothetical protein NZT92_03420 [Abditibacteriales bacterium]|nr:hypothetical protein [Abditibacteriales bacterium]MDW8364951.1 hypothetical protein [Abditibacteriales bacterium]